jgi:hypothetical protein
MRVLWRDVRVLWRYANQLFSHQNPINRRWGEEKRHPWNDSGVGKVNRKTRINGSSGM